MSVAERNWPNKRGALPGPGVARWWQRFVPVESAEVFHARFVLCVCARWVLSSLSLPLSSPLSPRQALLTDAGWLKKKGEGRGGGTGGGGYYAWRFSLRAPPPPRLRPLCVEVMSEIAVGSCTLVVPH